MTPEEIYDVWAPEGALWSRWVKPVLFAHMQCLEASSLRDDLIPQVRGIPGADDATAIVLDVPGYAGVWTGVALAAIGYRPVPLYNAAPGPPEFALIDVWPIVNAIAAATEFLKVRALRWSAPPAFLLDANRRGVGVAALPGWYDNRSISFPTDFPGSQFLLSHGIGRIILMQDDRLQPQPDVAHTLRGWQDSGIEIQAIALTTSQPPRPIRVERPRFYRSVWHRLLTSVGLRRNPLGGFGGTLSEASAG